MHIHKYTNWQKPEMVAFIYMPERKIGHELRQSCACAKCGKVKTRKVR